ncbi:MAG TPA: RraA family protein [Acidobacteriota bacterium]|nr:RraA family protein [Acidobacteriota bacterium]
MQEKLPDGQLDAIRHLDTCIVADAISALRVRLRNQGYSNGSLRCMFENPVPMMGYAVTGRIRCAEPPMVGQRFVENREWFKYITNLPDPRVVVLQDVDHAPGSGAFWDEVRARIHQRLGCVGAVTNGAVRELAKVRGTGFYLFAGSVTSSGGYAHIIDVGHPVEVGGLVIHPGDLIHGDVHGIVTVPRESLAALPGTARKILEIREQVSGLCASADFTPEKLMTLLANLE